MLEINLALKGLKMLYLNYRAIIGRFLHYMTIYSINSEPSITLTLNEGRLILNEGSLNLTEGSLALIEGPLTISGFHFKTLTHTSKSVSVSGP